MAETPQIGHSTYANNQFALADAAQGLASNQANQLMMPQAQQLHRQRAEALKHLPVVTPEQEEKLMAAVAATQRRLVQVFIVDPHESVPLADCLLHRGELQLTDLTDQELFFEIDIKTILDKHNAKRVELIDKSVKERTQKLEAARIRDLKMQIVTVAMF